MNKTTIVVFEFGRTPLLNSGGGRDHSLSTCAPYSAQARPNTVIGASNDIGLSTLPIDPQTEALSSGERLYLSNVLASVMTATGYDASALRTEPLPCIMA